MNSRLSGLIVFDMLLLCMLMMWIFFVFLLLNMWWVLLNEYLIECRIFINLWLMIFGLVLIFILRMLILKYLEWLIVDCIGCIVLFDIFLMLEDNYFVCIFKVFVIFMILVVWLVFFVLIFWIVVWLILIKFLSVFCVRFCVNLVFLSFFESVVFID